MNIAVCIKQVPFIYDVKFDPVKKTIVREGVQLIMNSLDRRALTQALLAREQFGGSVTVISMGPDQARTTLTEALATGADRAILLSDRAFAGSDTLATSRALALALKKAGPFDVIFCGRFSIDAETGQVGPEVAELLDLPQATNLRGVEFSPEGDAVTVQRETEQGYETLRVTLPALLTAGEWLNAPRRATPDQIEAAKARPIEVWTAADLSNDASIFGLSGSPTYVHEIRTLEPERDRIVVQGDDPEAAAGELLRYLQGRGLFTPWERAVAKVPTGRSVDPDPEKGIWVVAELLNGRPKNVTLELLSKAAELAQQNGGEVVAVVIGAGVSPAVAALAAYGADRVLVAEGPELGHYDTERHTAVLVQAIRERRPGVVLLGATVDGRDLAPRAAARLSVGLTGDCVDLELDAEGRLVQLKPAFGGNIAAPILSHTRPQIATVRPGMFQRFQPDEGRRAVIERLPADATGDSRVTYLGATSLEGASGVELDDAEVVVSVGAGIGTAENLPVVAELASALNGTIAASLRAVSMGLLPGPLQIGLTGRAIAPRFYFAVGVRGVLTHMMGVQKAGTIIAINNDPAADIFKGADFGIVGDFHAIVPAVTRAAAAARPQ